MSAQYHSIGVHESAGCLRNGAVAPQETVDLVLQRIAARGEDAVWISRRSDRELYQRAADLDRIRRERGTAAMPLAVHTHLADP